MIPPSTHQPFKPLPAMTCQYLDELLPFLQRLAPELHAKPNGQSMYCFPDGLILNLYLTTGKVVFQGPGAAGVMARQIARRIEQINMSGL